jgi:hypothetical protein
MSVALRNHWVSVGSPYRLATPARQLMQTLAGHGYNVEYYPDYAHQIAIPAEDHTAYSETGWPITAAFGVGWADDIMPHDDPSMPTPGQIGAKMVADKQAGRPELAPLKYLNWTDESGNCWHTKWQPSFVQTTSSDRGHTHVSMRSDMETSTAMEHYDPVAELMINSSGGDMPHFLNVANGGQYMADSNFEHVWSFDNGTIFAKVIAAAGSPTGVRVLQADIEAGMYGQLAGVYGVPRVPQPCTCECNCDDNGGNVIFPQYTVTFTGTGTSTPA